jgi:transposase
LDKEIGVPAQRIAMRRIREVLRLKQECELSYGQIAQALRISKGTVANYLSLAEAAGISHSVALGLDDATLLGRLYPKRYVYRQFALPDFAQVHRELKRKGVTLQLLWEEYREAAQGVAYSRSRFYERYGAYVGMLKRSMRQTHVAGEKLFVDFAGPTVPIYAGASGQESRAHIFVAVWGASRYTYVEATAAQTQIDWICAHVNALAFFGGCPALLVPDQPRALISKPERYEPQSHRTYEALAEHYGCAILPARPGKPRDKAAVELAVQNHRALGSGATAPSPLLQPQRVERCHRRARSQAQRAAVSEARRFAALKRSKSQQLEAEPPLTQSLELVNFQSGKLGHYRRTLPEIGAPDSGDRAPLPIQAFCVHACRVVNRPPRSTSKLNTWRERHHASGTANSHKCPSGYIRFK